MKLYKCIARLKARQPLPLLFPEAVWEPELSREILAAGDETLAPETLAACRAGLLLWNDDVPAAHDICQTIDNPTGSFWHAIVHRREGDAGNSLYWWRRTGQHPALATIYQHCLPLLDDPDADAGFPARLRASGTWLPEEFVQLCAAAGDGASAVWLQRLQVAEMAGLLRWCGLETS